MRLKLILPVIEAEKYIQPTECPYGCGGKGFFLRQKVKKQVCDTTYDEVEARRYGCLSCRRTFRVYPSGVNQKQFSQRAIGMAVMLYLLGLSYGAVVLMLEALGVWIGKTTVYEAVQAVAERVPGMKQANLLQDYRTPALAPNIQPTCPFDNKSPPAFHWREVCAFIIRIAREETSPSVLCTLPIPGNVRETTR